MVPGSEKWPGFTPPRATALRRHSVAYYCTAAYTARRKASKGKPGLEQVDLFGT